MRCLDTNDQFFPREEVTERKQNDGYVAVKIQIGFFTTWSKVKNDQARQVLLQEGKKIIDAHLWPQPAVKWLCHGLRHIPQRIQSHECFPAYQAQQVSIIWENRVQN